MPGCWSTGTWSSSLRVWALDAAAEGGREGAGGGGGGEGGGISHDVGAVGHEGRGGEGAGMLS